eukprot:TRINITY_DN6738_c0_g1_i1.p1 TRINITY_DN6738_c0_g1~~TRINITY_DN6738_c0_g1_i1.p1  ORF type:complete len:757 (+),score=219.81 TRINITY_DN6738_c0_g1_i1:627-2897(+)
MLRKWALDPALRSLCHQVVALHSKSLDSALTKASVNGVCQYKPDTEEWLAEYLIHLLTSLAAEDKLPALIFNFEETACENLAERVVEFLEAQEAEYRATPEFKKKMQDLAKRQKEAELRLKKHEKVVNSKRRKEGGGDDEGGGRDRVAVEEIDADQFVDLSDLGNLREMEVLPQFTFVRSHEGEGLDEEELAETMRRVEKEFGKDHLLHRSLMRGIGIHHFGLSYWYRSAVEVLFRSKHIKFVISTETMALGIHMPCRSVVFAGDHLQLNPLQFRQMSGRAGRRGFDMLGHVIFFGVPEAKINRLMTSEIQSLKGHWPMTPALAHRLIALYTHPHCKEKMQKRIQHQTTSLWLAPLIHIALPGEDVVANQLAVQKRTIYQVQIYFSTILDCLTSDGLLATDGQSEAFADTVAKLYRYEPAQFLFIALLRQGILHKVTSNYRPLTTDEKYRLSREQAEKRMRNNEQALEALLLVLSHVLARREIHRSVLADKDIDTEGVHQVYLPSLPSDVQAALDHCTGRVLSCFTAHLTNASKHIKEEGHKDALPLSGITFDKSAPADGSGIMRQLQADAIPFLARSPFVAIAGKGDTFETQGEMALTVRDGVCIDSEMIPLVETRDTSLTNHGALLLNAAVFDYQHSSSQDDVLKWNGLNYKESWEDLDRFMRFLQRLVRIVVLLERPPSAHGSSDTSCYEDSPSSSPLLRCLIALYDKATEAFKSADTKALSKQDQRKQVRTTLKKPKRPPLIKRDPRQVRRR